MGTVLIEITYNGLETEDCDTTKPVYFQRVAGIPNLVIRVVRYKPAPTLIVKLLCQLFYNLAFSISSKCYSK